MSRPGEKIQAETSLNVNEGGEALAALWKDEEPTDADRDEILETAEDSEDEEFQEETDVHDDEDEADEITDGDEDEEEVLESDDDIEDSFSDSSEWSGLDEILEAASVDSNDIPVTIRSNGQDVQVSLKEALNGYQRSADYNRRRQEVDSARDALRDERAAQMDKIAESTAEIAALKEVLESQINAELGQVHEYYGNVDWAKLRAEDPTLYNTTRADYEDSIRQYETRQNELKGQISQRLQTAADKKAEALEEFRKGELENLAKRVPEWQDRSALEEGTEQVSKYMRREYGATAQEVKQLIDHRIIDAFRKAMMYDALMADGNNAVKTGKGKPKRQSGSRTLRPGGQSGPRRGGQVQRSAKVEREAQGRLKKSGRERDASALLSSKWRT